MPALLNSYFFYNYEVYQVVGLQTKKGRKLSFQACTFLSTDHYGTLQKLSVPQIYRTDRRYCLPDTLTLNRLCVRHFIFDFHVKLILAAIPSKTGLTIHE